MSSPQQYLLLPVNFLLQSFGQEMQSSPSPTLQIPSPHLKLGTEPAQSLGQLTLFSKGKEQIPSPQVFVLPADGEKDGDDVGLCVTLVGDVVCFFVGCDVELSDGISDVVADGVGFVVGD